MTTNNLLALEHCRGDEQDGASAHHSAAHWYFTKAAEFPKVGGKPQKSRRKSVEIPQSKFVKTMFNQGALRHRNQLILVEPEQWIDQAGQEGGGRGGGAGAQFVEILKALPPSEASNREKTLQKRLPG